MLLLCFAAKFYFNTENCYHKFMKLENFQEWLSNYLNFEKKQEKGIFWLESVKFLCEKLGNPQDKIPCIHIAGSKGKGSTAKMISRIVQENGKKCGIYTSPHIFDFRERICTSEEFFDDEIYEKCADRLTNLVKSIPLSDFPEKRPLTWFELVTVFAFLCFEEAKCDFAVYEVGLGGRLDATNIVTPLVSVIMPIEKEHTEFLGNTIEKIAGEKAGIIKEKTPVVIAKQNYKEAQKVFIEKANEKNAELIFTEKCVSHEKYKFKHKKMILKFSIFGKKIKAKMNLLGKVQAENAETAALAVLKAFPEIKTRKIEKGLSKANLSGRFEIHKNVVFDGAHTYKSIENTIRTMKEVFPNKDYILLFSIAGDKDAKDIVPLFKGVFRKIIFTEGKTVRNAESEKLYEIAKNLSIDAENIPDLKNAIERVNSIRRKSDIILVTGSFYLVSEISSLQVKI